MDQVDKGRMVIALVSIAALMVVIAILGQSDKTSKPMNINGDQLGMENSESLDHYVSRSRESLSDFEGKAFALVTFRGHFSVADIGSVLEKAGIERVNAVVTGGATAIELPEPAQGVNRASVLTQQIVMRGADEDDIRSVVVYDNVKPLQKLQEESKVLAVEALPPDAAWGRIGIRPVNL
ncbi:hypothetical protein VH13_04140 [Corynebacterium ulcerans]|uniref:LytR/CpsA/Psr regulator C-terminal domain-containing protein n=1 Tax=Corynebacterium ramonii TaxID=3026968 RepID=A0ABM5RT81_9CORY|nr:MULTISPECIES: hypothetical protein [Corynebacterium]AIU33037.1 Hypothetical protein CulFRC11_1468 [Corynebacterium ramonii FRC0011]ESU57860.1 hypothetical protein D881_08720 [Corynebacterium ulcerans NCTC 12077]KKO85868.1 hypothetical protein VH13_04140 [Corynebacterium ulcerans]KKO87473.1 hypothetical protein VH15_04655 [Corynebacterium ulcerans]KPJ24061.1 hypothetical protein AOT31_07655 [Corynebacterium ulcerans]